MLLQAQKWRLVRKLLPGLTSFLLPWVAHLPQVAPWEEEEEDAAPALADGRHGNHQHVTH